MYAETFPMRLREARERAGYTQQQVMDLIKINQSTLSGYENGRTQPDVETLGKLSDLYETSLDWIVGTMGNNKK